MKRGYAALAIVGVAAAVAVFALTQSPSFGGMNLHSTDSAFNKYLAKHGKSYATKEEYAYRKSLFDAQMAGITEHNSQNDKSWFMALNKFSDMTALEVKQYLGGGVAGQHRPHLDAETHSHHLLTQSTVDWRNQMNPVRDQGQCGSCWAFAAIATLEGRYAVAKGSKVQLSEQQLVDCAGAVGCQGCNGGWSSKALQYLQSNGGSVARSSYPYTARQGSCKKLAAAVQVRSVSGISNAKSALAGGPLAIYLQADGPFMQYGGGIFDGTCGQYDHAVTLVGWGVSGSTEYWIVRNSWGSGWGESGHIRIKINGKCKITFDSYATV